MWFERGRVRASEWWIQIQYFFSPLSGSMAGHIINMAIQTFTPKKHASKKITLSPPPRYPAMPRYPPSMANDAEEIRELNLEVLGMECAACAGSIEKSVKRLPGIEDATVAVLQNRAQVIYHPAFVDVSLFARTYQMVCQHAVAYIVQYFMSIIQT